MLRLTPSRSRAGGITSLLLAVSLALAACGGSDSGDPAAGDGEGLYVIVTTNILGEVVTQLVGDAGTVDVLMEPGQDPHGFAPSARQAADLRSADVVVAVGLQLEEGLIDVLEAAEADGVEVVRMGELVDPIEFGGHGEDDHAEDDPSEDVHADEDHEDEDHADEDHADEAHADEDEHGHGALDPHFWFDPVRMADGVELMAARFAEIDETSGTDWEARGTEVADEIREIHDEIEGVLAEVPAACRRLVTNHDALGYLAARYDYEVVGTVIPGSSPQAAANAQAFAELVEVVRDTGVPAIFAETIANQDLARTLAQEVGRDIEVVELYTGSLGDADSGADTYAGMLTTDARLIADALADC